MEVPGLEVEGLLWDLQCTDLQDLRAGLDLPDLLRL